MNADEQAARADEEAHAAERKAMAKRAARMTKQQAEAEAVADAVAAAKAFAREEDERRQLAAAALDAKRAREVKQNLALFAGDTLNHGCLPPHSHTQTHQPTMLDVRSHPTSAFLGAGNFVLSGGQARQGRKGGEDHASPGGQEAESGGEG